MKFIKEKVFYKREAESYVDVFYDITDQLTHLPTCIKSIAVCFDSFVRNKYIENNEYIEANFNRFFNENTIEEGRIECNTEKILITLIDGFQLVSWNSEWGGINIIPPEK